MAADECICDKPDLWGFACPVHRVICRAVRPVRDTRFGACCEKAERVPCVCFEAWACPTHGTRHIGTHD